jgi:hypothetical protein
MHVPYISFTLSERDNKIDFTIKLNTHGDLVIKTFANLLHYLAN